MSNVLTEDFLVNFFGTNLIDICYQEGYDAGYNNGSYNTTNPYKNFSEVIYSEAWEEGFKDGTLSYDMDNW